MADIPGLPPDLQRALVSMLALILATPGLDADVARRAQWLKWKLEGFDPLAALPAPEISARRVA